MLDKYIKINETTIESKQTKEGVWYCNKVSTETIDEMDTMIGELNKMYNRHNKKETKASKKKIIKPKPPDVKGLQ